MTRTSLSIRFDGTLALLDQTALPDGEVWRDATDPDALVEAIRALRVRGAPAIGVAAALCLGGMAARGVPPAEIRREAARLRAARPTAVNLMWAMDRMVAALDAGRDLLAEALAVFDEDVACCDAMAGHGAALVEDGEGILTHCNTGGLATAGVGTALGVIRRAWESGKRVHVWVDETRPLLQGARLTAWELRTLGIPHTLVTDSMAAALMRAGRVQRVFVGADRIARNGDVANKIGTYGVAVAARFHGVPFHVVAPWSTVDLGCPDGAAIPIEERAADEVRGVVGPVTARWAPAAAPVWNPAFDVTPAALVTSLVLDTGVVAADGLPDVRR
ncbi:MAG: S-methyl-5-thioribose-1-phosphate isomerase [Myxococcota bacterium]